MKVTYQTYIGVEDIRKSFLATTINKTTGSIKPS